MIRLVSVFLLISFFITFLIVRLSVDSDKETFVIKKEDTTPLYQKNFFDFSGLSTIEESSSPEKSNSLDWWLSSGAYFFISNGVAKTTVGELAEGDYWRMLYAQNNHRDTDGGYHPQNIFRLVTKTSWKNFTQEMMFRIIKSNNSTSEYRNDSNGILFFNRYLDQNNLYYTGIRTDGFAVIKKKIKGKYYTLAYNKIFPGEYNRNSSPNLIPHNVWMGLKSEVINGEDDSVSIKVYINRTRNGEWELVAEVVDDGKQYGGKAFLNEGHAGIRTDFMDVEFDNYQIEEKI